MRSVVLQRVVGVGEVDAGRAHLVELLAVAGDGSGRLTTSRTSGPPKRVICTARMQVRPVAYDRHDVAHGSCRWRCRAPVVFGSCAAESRPAVRICSRQSMYMELGGP